MDLTPADGIRRGRQGRSGGQHFVEDLQARGVSCSKVDVIVAECLLCMLAKPLPITPQATGGTKC